MIYVIIIAIRISFARYFRSTDVTIIEILKMTTLGHYLFNEHLFLLIFGKHLGDNFLWLVDLDIAFVIAVWGLTVHVGSRLNCLLDLLTLISLVYWIDLIIWIIVLHRLKSLLNHWVLKLLLILFIFLISILLPYFRRRIFNDIISLTCS